MDEEIKEALLKVTEILSDLNHQLLKYSLVALFWLSALTVGLILIW